KRATDQARISIVQTGASLLAWKAKHGAFPNRLEEALPTIPTDPFDGKPLRYRRESNGFVVYSIGVTGNFDGGSPDEKPDAKESLFRYPRPSYLQ
ncbi:MAG TPA: hypothetical protein VKU00_32230, partial [Chthonomonadaceae bacterium]|nr:hypothetical protein [Chthonomonadaceae bacterium]